MEVDKFLLESIVNNSVLDVILALKQKADPNSSITYLNMERGTLFFAASTNNEAIVELLLSAGASTNSIGNANAMIVAIENSNQDIIHLLVKHGYALDQLCGSANTTPLQFACAHNNQDMVSLLLALGANVDTKDLEGRSSLYHAVSSRNEQLATLLVDRGASPGDMDTVLRMAVGNGMHNLITLLCEKGVSLNTKGGRKASILYESVYSEIPDMVELLLKYGADPNGTKNGETVLMRAVLGHRSPRVIESLLKAGADPNIRNKDTALTLACRLNPNLDTIEVLLRHGADPNICGEFDIPPLSRMVWDGKREHAELLIRYGAEFMHSVHMEVPDSMKDLV